MKSEWITVSLGEIANVKGGKRLPKGINLITRPNKHPYIRVRDLNGEKTLELNNNYEYVDDIIQKTISRYTVKKGDIVLSIVGTIGLVGIVGDSLDGANLTENCVKLTSLQGINKDYLYYFLKSFKGQQEIRKGVVGAVQAKLPIKNIQAIKLELPDIETQFKIVSILKALDDKIALNNKINDNLEQQAQAVFHKMFLEDAQRKRVSVKDVALNVTDGVHNTVKDDPDGQYYLLSCKNIKGGKITLGNSERKINEETFERLRKRTKLEKGDILLSSVGTIGELVLLNEEPSHYEFQRSVAMIKANRKIVSPEYLYEALLTQKSEIIHAAHGAVQQCVFISDILGFIIPLPTKEELSKFESLVVPVFDKIQQNENEIRCLADLRDTLLPKLMNGEIL